MNESAEIDLAAWNSPYHPVVQIIGWIVASLLSLETIIGNAMVIVAYKLERSISKQVSNRYIVSLAISDLIIGIEGIPLFTVYVINGDRWPLGSIACETWLFLDYTLCLVSILTVLLITADRYLSVCHTAKYLKWQSPTKTQVLIFLSWIIPAVIFGAMIYGWAFIVGAEDDSELGSTNGDCFAPFLSNPYVNMGMYIAYYWTTLVAMLILYKQVVGSDGTETLEVTREQRSLSFSHDPIKIQASLEKIPLRKKHRSLRATKSTLHNRMLDEEIETVDRHQKYMFKKHPALTAESSPDHSDATTVLLSRKISRISKLSSAGSSVTNSIRRKVSRKHSTSRLVQYDAVVLAEENGHTTFCEIPREVPSRGGWLASFRRKISRWIRSNPRAEETGQKPRKRSILTRARSISSSSSEDDSSPEDSKSPIESHRKPMPKISEQSLTVPAVKVTRDNQHKASNELTIPSPQDESRPSTGHSVVSRKISSISNITRDTTERILSSLFSPVTAFNRGRKRTKAEKRAHKAFRTITFIVGLFAILWSPYYVVATIYGFCKGECIPAVLYNLSYYMCYLNSSGNPFAYALANRQFRAAFLRMFRGNFNSHS
uniref:G-protein coupled receptors family 1 profile domain-containing protein n=2 Tax=Acrobeloides nanus TaxID=290746 RepID=A0A914C990_9BILA